MKTLVLVLLVLSTVTAFPQTKSEVRVPVLLEVTATHYYIGGQDNYQYLRIYLDGAAEAELLSRASMLDKPTVRKKSARLSDKDLTELRDLLNSGETGQLERLYKQRIGFVLDDFEAWDIRLLRAANRQQEVTLVAFAPDAATEHKKPYPRTLVKLGCLIDRLRIRTTGEAISLDQECKQSNK